MADGGVSVSDNGRGIPVGEHPVEKRPAIELVFTTLHAGGKFDGKSYAVSGGLHGVGSSVVNALSTRLEAEVRRNGHVWRQSYTWRGPESELQQGEETEATGTLIRFWPDPDIFEVTEWNFETLSRRMQEMAFLNRGLAITLRDERPDHSNGEPHVVRYHYEGGIEDFVRYINARKDAVHESVVYFDDHTEGMSVEIAMQWNSSYAESVHTFANTINTAEGGTHEEGFRAALTTIVNRYARDKGLLRDKDDNLTGEDVREASPRSSPSSWPTRSSRARPRPSSAIPRPSRSCSGRATSTCATGSRRTRARPRRSSTRRRRGGARGSRRDRRAT